MWALKSLVKSLDSNDEAQQVNKKIVALFHEGKEFNACMRRNDFSTTEGIENQK